MLFLGVMGIGFVVSLISGVVLGSPDATTGAVTGTVNVSVLAAPAGMIDPVVPNEFEPTVPPTAVPQFAVPVDAQLGEH